MKKLAIFFTLVLLASCQKDVNEPTTYTIRYEVTGSAQSVSITYQSHDGVSQIGETSTPWTKSIYFAEGAFVYLSAQNQTASGTVTVTIYKDGSRWKTSTSQGGYVIASVSGML